MRQRGWAVECRFFLLDVSKLLIPFLMCTSPLVALHTLETGLVYTDLLLFSLVCCWLAEELWAWSRKALLLMQVF
jgi:hypothetical protein